MLECQYKVYLLRLLKPFIPLYVICYEIIIISCEMCKCDNMAQMGANALCSGHWEKQQKDEGNEAKQPQQNQCHFPHLSVVSEKFQKM